MNCTNCQKIIPDDADFCKYCGAPAPFSSSINYHPETLFANEIVGGGPSSSASIEKSMADMEARLGDKLSRLVPNKNPKRLLWDRIQTIAVLLLVLSMIGGAFLFSRAFTKLDQINAKLVTTMSADSEMKTSLECLTSILQTLGTVQGDLSKLLEAQNTYEALQENAAQTPSFQIALYLNYDENGVMKTLNPVTLKPGEVLLLGSLAVADRAGYQLIGWNLKPDGSGTSYALEDAVGYFGYDVELYAQWEQIVSTPETTDAPVG